MLRARRGSQLPKPVNVDAAALMGEGFLKADGAGLAGHQAEEIIRKYIIAVQGNRVCVMLCLNGDVVLAALKAAHLGGGKAHVLRACGEEEGAVGPLCRLKRAEQQGAVRAQAVDFSGGNLDNRAGTVGFHGEVCAALPKCFFLLQVVQQEACPPFGRVGLSLQANAR